MYRGEGKTTLFTYMNKMCKAHNYRTKLTVVFKICVFIFCFQMSDVSETATCSIHKMPLGRECITHKRRICSGCSIVEHKFCQQLDCSIPLQDFVASVSRVCELIKCQLYMLGKEKHASEELVKDRCRLFREMIDSMEKRSLQDIDNGYQKQAAQMREYQSKFGCYQNIRSDVEEIESTQNDALRSCLVSKLTAMEKEPRITTLSRMVDDFLRMEAPSYLLKFQISETLEQAILQPRCIGNVSLSNLIQNDKASEKHQLTDEHEARPINPPTAPEYADFTSLPNYGDISQGHGARGPVGPTPPLHPITSMQRVDKPSPDFHAGGKCQPSMHSLQHGIEAIGLSGGPTTSPYGHLHGQPYQDPYQGLSMGRPEFVHPYQQVNPEPRQVPDTLTSFLSAPDGPPKQLKFHSNIHPRYMNETDAATISGVCFLDNGFVVLSDKSNCTVKIYDDMNVLVMFRKLDHKPYGVTQAPSGDIAVAVPKEHSVNILSSRDLSTVPNCWINNYKGKCFGLTSTNTHIFVIWAENDAKEYIGVYSSNYTEIRKISVSVERFLAVNPATQDVFYRVLNFGNDQIKCINPFSSDKTKWKVKVPSWKAVIEGLEVLKAGILISTTSAVQFMDFNTQTFTPIMKLKNCRHLAVNRNRSKVALVIDESDSLDDKDDVVGIHDLVY